MFLDGFGLEVCGKMQSIGRAANRIRIQRASSRQSSWSVTAVAGPAHKIAAKMADGGVQANWLPLESNPDLITEYLGNLGICGQGMANCFLVGVSRFFKYLVKHDKLICISVCSIKTWV
jgi:hypothetical protein